MRPTESSRRATPRARSCARVRVAGVVDRRALLDVRGPSARRGVRRGRGAERDRPAAARRAARDRRLPRRERGGRLPARPRRGPVRRRPRRAGDDGGHRARARPLWLPPLLEAFPGATIVQKNDLPSRKGEGLPPSDELLAGGRVPERAAFREHGLSFVAEVSGGPEDGLLPRPAREPPPRAVARGGPERPQPVLLLGRVRRRGARGRRVARDARRRLRRRRSSSRARITAERPGRRRDRTRRVETREADVFDDLRARVPAGETWDFIVTDPPAFAKRKADVDRACRGYKDINRLAFQLLAPGGLLLACSCSGPRYRGPLPEGDLRGRARRAAARRASSRGAARASTTRSRSTARRATTSRRSSSPCDAALARGLLAGLDDVQLERTVLRLLLALSLSVGPASAQVPVGRPAGLRVPSRPRSRARCRRDRQGRQAGIRPRTPPISRSGSTRRPWRSRTSTSERPGSSRPARGEPPCPSRRTRRRLRSRPRPIGRRATSSSFSIGWSCSRSGRATARSGLGRLLRKVARAGRRRHDRDVGALDEVRASVHVGSRRSRARSRQAGGAQPPAAAGAHGVARQLSDDAAWFKSLPPSASARRHRDEPARPRRRGVRADEGEGVRAAGGLLDARRPAGPEDSRLHEPPLLRPRGARVLPRGARDVRRSRRPLRVQRPGRSSSRSRRPRTRTASPSTRSSRRLAGRARPGFSAANAPRRTRGSTPRWKAPRGDMIVMNEKVALELSR